MLDDFLSNHPKHFTTGFPWHPHHGIETITYVLKGDVEHGDSMGARGSYLQRMCNGCQPVAASFTRKCPRVTPMVLCMASSYGLISQLPLGAKGTYYSSLGLTIE
jgi:hypothetical protein